MDRKKAPHKLQVEDSKQDDNSIVEMTQAKMDELKIFRGDAVVLKGMSLFLPSLSLNALSPLMKIPLNVVNGARLASRGQAPRICRLVICFFLTHSRPCAHLILVLSAFKVSWLTHFVSACPQARKERRLSALLSSLRRPTSKTSAS